jgi:hypothetical protein
LQRTNAPLAFQKPKKSIEKKLRERGDSDKVLKAGPTEERERKIEDPSK